jgi:hypothetical protein
MTVANLEQDLLKKLIDDFNLNNSLIQNGENEYLQNYEALEYFKQKQSQLQNILTITDSCVGLKPTSMTLAESDGVYPANELLIPVERLVSTMETLLEEFKDEGITLTPRVQTEEGLIDLFIKTSDRRSFGLMLRSNGTSKVKWREDRGEFFVTRKKGTSKWSELDSVAYKLNSIMNSLRDKEDLLLGSSKTERKKALTKAIVLTGQTRLDPTIDPTRLVNFGRTTALRMNVTSTYYLLDRANLANFLRKPIESAP